MPLVDVKALASALAVSERTVYDLVRDQQIPYVRIGRLIRFDLTKVLAHLTVSPTALTLETDHEQPAPPYIRPPKRRKGKRIDWRHPYYTSEG